MKSTLSLVFMLCITVSVFAQETATSSKLNISIFGGLNTSRNIGYLSQFGEPRTGFLAGLNISTAISKSFEIQTRLMYESKRNFTTYRYHLFDGTNEDGYEISNGTTTELNYLTVQVLPTFRFGAKKQFFVGVGGYYGRLLSGTLQVEETNATNGSISTRFFPAERMLDTDYDAGLSYVAGYTAFINNQPRLDFQISYNAGLVDHHDYFNVSQRNRSFNFTMGYRLLRVAK